MSFHAACDLSTCGNKAHISIIDGQVVKPTGWRDFWLDDFCFHGCSEDHLIRALAEDAESKTKATKLPILSALPTVQDDRTPSDQFPITGGG